MRIGYIGLGRMGRPMALNLIKAGHELIVHSRSPGAVETLVHAGAIAAASPAEVAERVDLLGACLLTPEQSLAIFLGPRGVVEAKRPGLVCIDFATIDPMTSRKIGAGLAEHEMGFLDAPISGGPKGAAAGTLSTPQVSGVIVALVVLSAAALFGLQRLLGSEEDSPQ